MIHGLCAGIDHGDHIARGFVTQAAFTCPAVGGVRPAWYPLGQEDRRGPPGPGRRASG